MHENLVQAVAEMQEKEAVKITKDLIATGEDPMSIISAGTKAMGIVGERFESGQYFLPHLILAGNMLKQISEIVKPLLKGETKTEYLGKILMGTVQGDVHDIGKDIVTFLLDVNGFEVKDIGINVPPETFIEEIRSFQPSVVGLSCLLTVAYESMKETVAAIDQAGLRDDLKIMIGGAQTSDKIAEYTGADAYGKDAFDGVNLAKKWICSE